jgi:NAD(P)H-hydrate epimerase
MRVSVLCGRGNNGGDGFVAARALASLGVNTSVALIGESARLKGDARINFEALRSVGVDLVEISDAGAWELHGAKLLDTDLIVDALVGTGLNEALSGLHQTVVDDINASAAPVASIDLPSGLSADSPEPIGPVVDATLTVTLAAPKLSLVLPPGETLAGTLAIADIGIPAALISEIDGPWVELLTKDLIHPLIRPRTAETHKGDYGHVLIVAGSRGKTGAAILAGVAALRSGAGLVTVAAPAGAIPIIATAQPELMTLALPEDANGYVEAAGAQLVLDFDADVIAIGPGLGRTAGVRSFVQTVVGGAGVPVILDADAIVAFAGQTDQLIAGEELDLILTPHPGEMAALTGVPVDDVQAHRIECARDFASTHHCHLVLKGHRTVVATPEGHAFINLTGNPGMATAGSGDVLTGVLAAWTAQLQDTKAACQASVYLHGLAGDLAEADEGETALIASDIIACLGDAVLELTGRRKKQSESV